MSSRSACLLIITLALSIAGVPAFAGAPAAEAFPEGFRWGTVVSAHAVEGNHVNDWSLWEAQPGKIADGSVSGAACNHWELHPEDVAWMKKLGQNAALVSLEWSRLQPAKGPLDPAAVANYRARFAAMRQQGIVPIVILWDRTLPQWVAAYGGLLMPAVITDFQDFAGLCATAFGDLVDHWVTLRDPNGFAAAAFREGRFPPGMKDLKFYGLGLINLLGMHRGAWQALKAKDQVSPTGVPPAQVGLLVSMKWVRPHRPGNPMDVSLARTADLMGCWSFLDAVMKGDLLEANPGTPMPQGPKGKGLPNVAATGVMNGDPKGVPEAPPQAPPPSYDKRRADFVFVAYRGLDEVKFNVLQALCTEKVVPAGAVLDDEGQVVFADGLTSLLLSLRKYPVPVFAVVGIADAGGQKRAAFLSDHARQARAAIAQGANLRGFFYDGLLAGFEYDRGFALKKGLLNVNPKIQERKPAPGAEVFRGLALTNGASDAPRRMQRPKAPATAPAEPAAPAVPAPPPSDSTPADPESPPPVDNATDQ